MTGFPRHFTVDEAEALIPHLERLLSEVRALRSMIDAKVAAWRRRTAESVSAQALVQGQVDFLVTQVNARLDQIVQLGCQPKDLEKGLIDFPSRVDGREINLCWRSGEKKIVYWHGLDEGFDGRKPLGAPSRPTDASR